MSQSFSFPPPPPPPPKRDYSSTTTAPRGGFRGRGHPSGYHSRGSTQPFNRRIYQGYSQAQHGRGNSSINNSTVNTKRDHTQAFGHQIQGRPRAPPPVPDFNIDTKSLLPLKPSTTKEKSVQKKGNALGLTPKNQNTLSDSEDDADDESKLAQNNAIEGLQFEHKGKTLSLNTPDEIAAWIAERRRRFPTQAKAEAAKKEAEERKKVWEEQKLARKEIARQKKEVREAERKEKEKRHLKDKLIAAQVAKAKSAVATSKEDIASKAKEKAEKLRKKAEKAARDLQKAEEALLLAEQSDAAPASQRDGEAYEVTSDDGEITLSEHSDSEDTSSSGFSATETDAESGPEESTSRRTAPDKVTSPKQPVKQPGSESATLCRNILKFGRCRYGKNCRYSHERKKDKPNIPSLVKRRKGLYQTMVEKEKAEQMMQAVKTIVKLGDQGFFNEPQKPDVSSS